MSENKSRLNTEAMLPRLYKRLYKSVAGEIISDLGFEAGLLSHVSLGDVMQPVLWCRVGFGRDTAVCVVQAAIVDGNNVFEIDFVTVTRAKWVRWHKTGAHIAHGVLEHCKSAKPDTTCQRLAKYDKEFAELIGNVIVGFHLIMFGHYMGSRGVQHIVLGEIRAKYGPFSRSADADHKDWLTLKRFSGSLDLCVAKALERFQKVLK